MKRGYRLPTQIPRQLKQYTNARAYPLAPRRTREQMIGGATRLSHDRKNVDPNARRWPL